MSITNAFLLLLKVLLNQVVHNHKYTRKRFFSMMMDLKMVMLVSRLDEEKRLIL